MSRVFVTGDKHGRYDDLIKKLKDFQTTKNDVVIVLGDHGTLYYGPKDDRHKKKFVSSIPATFIMIRGNHDRRASAAEYPHKAEYFNTPMYEGDFWYDPEFPSILYTKEYGWYRFGTKQVFVVNGAYSVDKQLRLQMRALGFSNYHWFEDEQLSEQERNSAITCYINNAPDCMHYVMSHTCPIQYKPWDKLLSGVDQNSVDESMENWLKVLESSMPYQKWYCGHWHIERSIDRMRFMYEDVELFNEVEETKDESGDQEET